MTKIESVKKVSVIGIVVNLLLLVIKLTVGIISRSTSMLADAIHSIEDSFCSILSYIGAKISSKDCDDLHPYGFGKVEYVFSLIISIIMILASFSIIQTIFEGFVNLKSAKFSVWLIIVCLANILLKLILFLYSRNIYRKQNDILIKSSMEDHRNDMFLTLGTLFGVIFGYFNIRIVDIIVGILISTWIFYVGVNLFVSSYKVLIDTSLSYNILEKIDKEIKKYCIECNVVNIITKPVGDRYLLILKILVNKDEKLENYLLISNNLKIIIKNNSKYIYDVITDICIDM